MRLDPGTRLGPYEILAAIGAGGMGDVYQALDTRLDRTVAIKVSREQFSERFEREARAVAALNHPNICTLHDVGSDYLVMELIEGPTLADRIDAGPVPLAEALAIARQIADALEAAHERGIVHRDLKPGNIKIKPDGQVKVLDFGLAKVGGAVASAQTADSPTISMAATQAGVILGTAAYMAPEQARGKPVDKRADIWAFGVVLYEMITGRRLFQGEDVTDTLATVIKSEPNYDGVPSHVERLLKSCLEKDPARRLRDIGDAWRLLDQSPAASAPTRTGRAIAGWIVSAASVLALATLAFVHYSEQPPAAEALRFHIVLPENRRLANNDVSVSPDGLNVAFQMRNPDGVPQLWLHSLRSLESRPLAGTEGVSGTSFWSPDSRFIGFSVPGRLKKIEIAGGSPRTVCDLPQGLFWRGGAWNRDGVILFGLSGAEGLRRVSDSGGAPAAVTTLVAGREAQHAAPYFLPDGRHFIYYRFAEAGEESAIYVGSLDSKPEEQSSTPLVAADAGAVYAPPAGGSSTGYLLFARDGSVMAQVFDIHTLKLVGEALPVAETGVEIGNPRNYSASHTGILAYRSSSGFASSTQLSWFARDGKPLGIVGDNGNQGSIALSPDGTRVAVSRRDPQTVSSREPLVSIWVHEFARGTSTRITSEPGRSNSPVWSPDGSRIFYTFQRTRTFDLYQKAADGTGTRELLLPSDETRLANDWSHRGNFLLYSATPKGPGAAGLNSASFDLWVLPLTGGDAGQRKPEPYLKTEASEIGGRFSPDGRYVAYVSDASGIPEVYVRPFPNAAGGQWTISKGGGAQPVWRADGKELYYISRDFKLMAVEVSMNPAFKAGASIALFQTRIPSAGSGPPRHVASYGATADGKKFLVLSPPPDAAASVAPPVTVVLNWTSLLKK